MTSATEAGTAQYRYHHTDLPGHFRHAQGLWLSSIGLGTYLGRPTAESDADYVAAVKRALTNGVNVIDTASNYRFQRSERAVGQAIAELMGAERIRRDEVVLATKGGGRWAGRPGSSARWEWLASQSSQARCSDQWRRTAACPVRRSRGR